MFHNFTDNKNRAVSMWILMDKFILVRWWLLRNKLTPAATVRQELLLALALTLQMDKPWRSLTSEPFLLYWFEESRTWRWYPKSDNLLKKARLLISTFFNLMKLVCIRCNIVSAWNARLVGRDEPISAQYSAQRSLAQQDTLRISILNTAQTPAWHGISALVPSLLSEKCHADLVFSWKITLNKITLNCEVTDFSHDVYCELSIKKSKFWKQ